MILVSLKLVKDIHFSGVCVLAILYVRILSPLVNFALVVFMVFVPLESFLLELKAGSRELCACCFRDLDPERSLLIEYRI